jgi:sulfur relay (sulfurtransferase) complex TusBCD TusD component (DsrE family)
MNQFYDRLRSHEKHAAKQRRLFLYADAVTAAADVVKPSGWWHSDGQVAFAHGPQASTARQLDWSAAAAPCRHWLYLTASHVAAQRRTRS